MTGTTMTTTAVWFITGAARGMGVDLAKAALDAGHRVVGTARDAAKVTAALGEHDNLLAVSLDITDPAAAQAAVDAAVERFGRIDVLVNNAGNFYAGYFEEISDAQFRAQMETNFFGPLNVTRAVLPVMRGQRSGQVVTITSTAGIIGGEFCAAYAASKFALEGWMESLRFDVAPVRHLHHHRRARLLPHRAARRGRLLDLARAVDRRLRRAHRADHHRLEEHERPAGRRPRQARPRPRAARWPSTSRRCAGSPAPTPWPAVEQKAHELLAQADAHRELSSHLDHDDA